MGFAETVRKAGQQLNRAVSGLCAKLSDPSQSDASSGASGYEPGDPFG